MKNLNIIKNKKWYFAISAVSIIPGLISLVLFGLLLGIDFTGGSKLEITKSSKIDEQAIVKVVENNKAEVHAIQDTDNNILLIRTSPINQQQKEKIMSELTNADPAIQERSFDTVGPTIGAETTRKALLAVVLASLGIMAYIAYAFREVSKPLASWKYGASAIVALLHDALFVLGMFSLAGYFFHVEVDSLFITALLTVMGFSVHDTIVVFDRVRENLKRHSSLPFDEVVNTSILETINRSLNTSITVAIVLFTLLVFGGENIRWFVGALLIGVISGTYSSIFNASPLLVVWNDWDHRQKKKKKK